MALDRTIPGSYIGVGGFTSAATGVDPNALPAGELARFIYRASRAADRICRQVLYASLDTVELNEDRQVDGFSISLGDGLLYLFPRRFPIRSVSAVKQFRSASDSPTALSSAWVHIDSGARYIWVEGTWSVFRHRMPPMYVQLAYLNGWLATPLSAASSNAGPSGVGLLTLVPQPGQATVQGVYAGQSLELQDALPEIVSVQSVSGNVVTLSAPLVSTHAADTFVVEESFDELSFADVQQAVINLTAHFIKEKGIGPLVLKNDQVEGRQQTVPERNLYEEAVDLLIPFTVQF